MESQSEENPVFGGVSSFFEGLLQTPKLNQKQQRLREQIQVDSQQKCKQTSLQDKVANRNTFHFKNQSMRDTAEFVEQSFVEANTKKQKREAKGSSHKSFDDLRIIKPVMKAINDINYLKPTPIQASAIPVINSGKDVVASSITGSGKTAAFLIPIIQRFYNAAAVGYIRALIVTPTRELAIQIFEEFQKLNKYSKLDAVLVIGASSIQRQEMSLRNHPELVVGTPGRLIDVLLNSRSIGIESLEMIVFDEADKLLELGFEAQIKQLMSHAPEQVQTIMFSATMGKQVKQLAGVATHKPIRISADPDHKTAQKLHQQVIKLKEDTEEQREAVLVSVLNSLYSQKVIIFFKTKRQCHRVAIILNLLGFKACELHGNLSQTQRIKAFVDFKEGRQDLLLATDLAARGLDIKEVKTVINYQLPVQLTKYIHRIGRTARAGCIGTSLTICSDTECLELKRMSKKTGDKLFKLNLQESSVKHQLEIICDLEREIASILFEEKEERDFRKAEMELDKLQNINEHRDQIYSRPKREWFMSEGDKRKIKDEAKVAAGVPLTESTFKTKPIRKDFKGKKNMTNRSKRRAQERRE